MKIVETYIIFRSKKENSFDESDSEGKFVKVHRTESAYLFIDNTRAGRLEPITEHDLETMMTDTYIKLGGK